MDFLDFLFKGAEEVGVKIIDEETSCLLRKIKSYSHPPKREDDFYNHRKPWSKLGVVSSEIGMGWYWFKDEVIMEKATREDLMLALSELENQENGRC